jgi:HSP20 family molecular chaperone IbpA
MASSEIQRRDEGRVATSPRPITTYSPATDIVEEGDRLVIKMDLPGVSKDQMTVRFADGVLTVTGARNDASFPKQRHGEFGEVRYSRAFAVPDQIDASRTEAVLKNGVLTLTLPKVEAARPRKIEVKLQ